MAHGSAPLSSRKRTTFRWPLCAARMRGVSFICALLEGGGGVCLEFQVTPCNLAGDQLHQAPISCPKSLASGVAHLQSRYRTLARTHHIALLHVRALRQQQLYARKVPCAEVGGIGLRT